jgi:signal transduction histidine kinase
MADLRMFELSQHQLSQESFREKAAQIQNEKNRNFTKYASEGITFFILIVVGAGYVYSAVRRQFQLQQQQENFTMAVTHELKTPISVARLNLETLQKYSLDPARQRKLMQMTVQEMNRLNTLINNILVSSQLEGGVFQMTKEELDLSDLVKDCVNDFRNRYADRVFRDYIKPDMEVIGDPLLLQILINNLLENAVKYSPKGSPVSCVLKQQDGQVQLSVIDEGIGIETAERKNIFKKFYRGGDEVTRKTQGTGLGLYLCSRIAADHNATINITNRPGGGSIFTLTFNT